MRRPSLAAGAHPPRACGTLLHKGPLLEPDTPLAATPSRRIALLIDADNVSHAKIGAILAELSKYGTANIRRAYGNWAAATLKGWTAKLHDFAIRPIQQFSYSTGKNATDIALVIDAMELLYTQDLDAFAIASSDADFTPLIMQLKANGHEVYGFGERKTPTPFVNACTTFLFLDGLEDSTPPAEPEAEAPAAAQPKPRGRRKAAPATAPAAAAAPAASPEAPTTPAAKSLAQDSKLITTLRGAVEAAARDDGWAHMAAAGSAVKRQAPIDPRNYGVKNFPRLFEATGLFYIMKGDNGQTYVADKRNTDRAAKPGG